MSYIRSQQTKHRLYRLYNETKHSYGSGAYFDSDKNRYVKYTSCNMPMRKVYKKQSVKTLRRNKHKVPSKGCTYKKYYDLQWKLT